MRLAVRLEASGMVTQECRALPPPPSEHWNEMVNDDTTESIVNPGESLRVIRSHRREPDYSYTKPFTLLLILVLCSPFLVRSIVPATAKHQTHAAAPQSMPIIGPVKAPSGLEAPQPQQPPTPITGSTEARSERASRSETRKPADLSKIEIVVAFALSQQGKPYEFGTSGPRAYDCSGLVKRAFAQIGMELYHYTGRQMAYGSRVTKAQLQRGDIVFPTSGHVGIYLGNNQMVHASSGKGQVAVAEINSFYTARRLA